MILVVDNFDSFTYNLADYFRQLDLKVEVLRNNADPGLLMNYRYDAVVLSPGPGVPETSGRLMEILHYYHDKRPVLGVCLGHQAIASYFGGDIKKALRPMHGKISPVSHEKDVIFANLPARFEAVRYHSLICSNLSHDLQVIAKDDLGEVMAIRHSTLPVYGLQFHPEAVLTRHGLEILKNWKEINALSH